MIKQLKKIQGDDQKEYVVVSTMQEAVDEATTQATSGDVILLSPGTSSFGVFKNEFDRGNQFRKIVQEL
jgi:UDP-N-acetylmuramoylalanine--D-glutamate ligase